MGLSSKQVSGDGLDWAQKLLEGEALEIPKVPQVRQQQQVQQQQTAPLKCPRCDSSNTKFCYYNNYNRSQPRHFCKSCRRHWTKGGTLRNVPVGGGRKNKRLKTTKTPTTTTTTTTSNNNDNMGIQPQQQQQNRHLSGILYPALLHPTSLQQDYINRNNNNNSFMGSTSSLPPLPNFPFTSSFDNPSSMPSDFTGRFQSSNVFNYTGGTETAEDLTNTPMPTPWQIPSTSSLMDPTSYWSWDDLNTLISTDLKQPWEDSRSKHLGS